MSRPTPPADHTATDDCTTTNSFDDHGVATGADLIARTYYRLAGVEPVEFEPTEAFFDRLESAFLWAYLGSVEAADVPRHVETAVADARELTREAFADRDHADLRTEVVPAFYRRVAGLHCEYRDAPSSGE